MAQLLDKAKNFVADKVTHMKKPEADLTDIDIKHVSRDSITLESQISITNPYSHDMPICQISYTLKSAGKVIASGTMMDPGSITANESTSLALPVKVPYDILLTLAKDAGRDWDIDYEWEVDLTMHIPIFGKFTLPIHKKGDMKLPTLSDIF